MKFLLRFAGWSVLAFVPAWFLAHPYQHFVAGIAASLVAPPDSRIEFVDLDVFYPFDVGLFVALCLASSWASLAKRGRAILIGYPLIAILEVLSIALALGCQLAAASSTSPNAGQTAQRLADGVIRLGGVVPVAALWFLFLGRERLALVRSTRFRL